MLKLADKSLKQRNLPQLIVFLSLNLILVGAAIVGLDRLASAIKEVLTGDLSLVTKAFAYQAIGTLVVGLLSWAIPKEWKEVIVFWHAPPRNLPSNEAFSKIAPADLRIDMDALPKALGPLPSDYSKQSALWYTVYRKHRNEMSVEDANAAYLLYREMVGLLPILILGTLGAMSWRGRSVSLALAFLALTTEFVAVMFATRNAGTRLVANVLALESATPSKPFMQSRDDQASEPKTKRSSPRVPKARKAGGDS